MIRRTKPKVRRNDKCSCGSGKKYKYCCWGRLHPDRLVKSIPPKNEVSSVEESSDGSDL